MFGLCWSISSAVEFLQTKPHLRALRSPPVPPQPPPPCPGIIQKSILTTPCASSQRGHRLAAAGISHLLLQQYMFRLPPQHLACCSQASPYRTSFCGEVDISRASKFKTLRGWNVTIPTSPGGTHFQLGISVPSVSFHGCVCVQESMYTRVSLYVHMYV